MPMKLSPLFLQVMGHGVVPQHSKLFTYFLNTVEPSMFTSVIVTALFLQHDDVGALPSFWPAADTHLPHGCDDMESPEARIGM